MAVMVARVVITSGSKRTSIKVPRSNANAAFSAG
jgi:hypothetical protein